MEGTIRYDKVKEQLARFHAQSKDWFHKYQWQGVGAGLLIVALQCGEVQFAVNGLMAQDQQPVAWWGEDAGASMAVDWSEEDKSAKVLPAHQLSWDEAPGGAAEKGGPKKAAPATDIVQAAGSKRDRQMRYIERFKEVARGEMKKYGIPASVTLAQGLLESDAGKSQLASRHNNHFGIKCFDRGCRPGHCVNYSDDSHKDFFRSFPSAWESYRAHSQFLQRDRYKSLHKLSSKDYKGWARGLQKAGYATDPGYAQKLIHLVEELRLHRFDH